MSIPTVPNFDLERIPTEGSPTFRADASYVWSTLPEVIAGYNSSIAEINDVAQTVNQDALQVSINKSATALAMSEAVSAKDEAVLAKDEIKGYVIPEEATYSPATIEAKIDMTETLNLIGAI